MAIKIIETALFLGLYKASNYKCGDGILEENFSSSLVPVLKTPQSLSLSATTSHLLPPVMRLKVML